MNYVIGQIFEGVYPPEAAEWCGENNAIISEIEPLNNVRRFQIQEMPKPSAEEQKQIRIDELKAELDATDYKIIKCSEYQLSNLELPYDINELHSQRQAIRDEINELEG